MPKWDMSFDDDRKKIAEAIKVSTEEAKAIQTNVCKIVDEWTVTLSDRLKNENYSKRVKAIYRKAKNEAIRGLNNFIRTLDVDISRLPVKETEEEAE